MKLSDAPLFRGLNETEVASLLDCLNAAERSYPKGAILLTEGEVTDRIGLVLSGMAVISCSDIWGNASVLGHVPPGSVFAEVYACLPNQPMLVSVSAAEETSVLFLNAGRVLHSCSSACPFHARLIQNLLAICAHKSLRLSQRILHTSPKSIRGRLTSYFSECAREAGGNSFQLPYNRQQLADYLNVDRSALCSELSRMQKDGLIEYRKNQIRLLV